MCQQMVHIKYQALLCIEEVNMVISSKCSLLQIIDGHLKPVSHQSVNHFAVRFAADIRPCGESQTKLHTSCKFSLNVRHQCDARMIVLRSWAGLSRDELAVWLCVSFANFMGSQHSCGSCTIKRKVIARLSRDSLVAFTGKIHECELIC